MFNTLKYLAVLRSNSNEINQSFIRLGLVTAIFLYANLHDYLNHELVISRNYPLLTSFLFIATLECYWAFKCSDRSELDRQRIYFRIITNVVDNILLAVAILYMKESGAPLFVIYLWITFGIGLRYGGRYLIFSAILNIASFLTVITIDPIWTDGDTIYISIGILISLVILPLYVYILISKLSAALKSEKAAHRVKQIFLANMNHELRTPLNSILNLTELISTYKLPVKVSHMLDMVRTSTKTQLQIVNGILDISKIESGQYKFNNNRFNLYDLIYEVRQIILPLADEKCLRYLTYIESSCKRNYVGASDQIRQVLINLLGNAVKFTDTGFVKITVQSGILSPGSHEIIFRIEDSGIGISEQNQVEIFKPFNQADSTVTRKYGGTGLGVTIANELAMLMGGTLSLESHLGVGSIFTFKMTLSLTERDVQYFPDDFNICPLNLGEEYSEILSYYSKCGLNVNVTEISDNTEYKHQLPANNTIFLVDYDGANTVQLDSIWHRPDIITIAANRMPDSNDGLTNPITSINLESSKEDLLNAIDICQRHIPRDRNNITILPKVNRQLNVLIVEDDATLREIYRLIFTSTGHNACITTNGQEALDAVIKSKYELIILDMHMPELSGIDVAKQIKYLLPSDICRIVLLTADTNSVATAYELNDIFSLVLTKPINPIDLLHNVHKLFDLQPMTGYQEGIIPTGNQSITNKEIQSRRLLNNIQVFGADAFRSLLMIYDSEVNERLIKLSSAILSQNYSDKQSILHTLHGASLSVGSNEMGEELIALLGDVSKTHQFDVNELLIVGSLAQLHKTFMCNCLEYLETLDFNEKYIGRTHGRR